MFSHWVWGISARQQHPFKIQSQYSEFALKLIPLFITEKKKNEFCSSGPAGSRICIMYSFVSTGESLFSPGFFFWRDFSAFVAACSAPGLEIFWAGMIPEKRSASSWSGGLYQFCDCYTHIYTETNSKCNGY